MMCKKKHILWDLKKRWCIGRWRRKELLKRKTFFQLGCSCVKGELEEEGCRGSLRLDQQDPPWMPAENFVPNWAPQCLNSKGLNEVRFSKFHLTTSGLVEWREKGRVSWQSGLWACCSPKGCGVLPFGWQSWVLRGATVWWWESGEVGMKRWLSWGRVLLPKPPLGHLLLLPLYSFATGPRTLNSGLCPVGLLEAGPRKCSSLLSPAFQQTPALCQIWRR